MGCMLWDRLEIEAMEQKVKEHMEKLDQVHKTNTGSRYRTFVTETAPSCAGVDDAPSGAN
jgi:hypothetical protein